MENKPHRTPKEVTTDYHTDGKYPWRHAFRRHLAENPHLWTVPVKPSVDDLKLDVADVKLDLGDVKLEVDDVKLDVDDLKLDVDDVKLDSMEVASDKLLPDLSDSVTDSASDKARTIDSYVKENLQRVIRKRSWSGCSDSSYDSDESLQPVEKEFEQFINEVNKKW